MGGALMALTSGVKSDEDYANLLSETVPRRRALPTTGITAIFEASAIAVPHLYHKASGISSHFSP